VSAVRYFTEEQIEAMIDRAAEAGAMRAIALMQGELKKRVAKPARRKKRQVSPMGRGCSRTVITRPRR
jgi:hypothetical protein